MSFFKNKNKKIYIYILSFVGLTVLILFPLLYFYTASNNGNDQDAQLVNVPVEKKIVLITHYVAGQDTVETKVENIKSIDDVKTRFSDWKVTEETADQIVLERTKEDLSPNIKQSSYFGLGPDGYLTLYRGNSEQNEVIQTFFRIDIEKLESGLPREPLEQLYQGIPIQDLAEYNSVLSTFSEFSVD